MKCLYLVQTPFPFCISAKNLKFYQVMIHPIHDREISFVYIQARKRSCKEQELPSLALVGVLKAIVPHHVQQGQDMVAQ